MASVAEEVDHNSHLPDAVIRHIFCFLPFKDVVRTSVLSKQWRSAWTSTPYIDLSLPSRRVVPSIGSALSLCKPTKLEKFHVDVTSYDLDITAGLERWFHFAAARKMEDVSLGFRHGYQPAPLSLCDCASLVSLRLFRCHFLSDNTIHWPSLKKLSLHDVLLNNGKLIKILSGCPVLESLTLRHQPGTGTCNLSIESRSLRELVIEADYISSLDILAPNLLRLRLSGELRLTGLTPNGVSSLAEAELDFDKQTDFRDDFSEGLRFLLEQLQHVAKITVGSWCLEHNDAEAVVDQAMTEFLSAAEEKGMSYLSSRWRNIIVYTKLCKRELLGLAYLMQSSPLLERLVICNPKSDEFMGEPHQDCQDFSCLEKAFLAKRKEGFCWENRLKRVEIAHFRSDCARSKLLLELIKFLLRRAVRLEKMIIRAELRKSNGGVPIGPHDLIMPQRWFQRASRKAEVIVNYSFNGLPYVL